MTRGLRRSLLACAALLLAGFSVTSAARADARGDTLIREHLRARGASQVKVVARDFLFEGQALVRTMQFPRAGCRAVFAWGGKGVSDVDVGFYSVGGLLLAEDRGATPYAYARLCADAGVTVYASAQAYAGRGEVALYEADDAPRSFGRPPKGLSLSLASGGRASAMRSVGAEQNELAIEAPLVHDERVLAEAGYVALGPPSLLEVRGGVAEGAVILAARSCFRLIGFVPGARGVLLEVERGTLHREARTADGELLGLSLCVEQGGPYVVRIHTRALRSLSLLRVFEHPLAQHTEAALYGDERALKLAETRVIARERGFALSHLGEVWSDGNGPLSWPLTLAPHECALLAALPEQEVEAELQLVDDKGVVLAHNEGRHGVSTLFTCASEGRPMQLWVQGRGEAGPISLFRGSARSP